jgi:sulfite reductase beta subunit-like hemoprotein
MAMGELFSDHGNREDRNAARIRFIVKKLGEDAFRKLFLEYYAKAQTPSWAKLPPVKAKAEGLSASGSFVKLPFKEGFIELERFEALAKLVEDLKQPFVRFAQDQSVYLPCVETKDVEGIFSKLGLPDPAPAPVSCIGAGLCKIGALDARAASARVRDALSSLQAPKKSVDAIAKAIRISGCLNCCSGHLVSPLGLQGQGKAGSGSFKLFVKGSCCDGSASIGVNEGSWLVPEDKVGEMVKSLAGAFLKSGAERFDKWLSANAGAVWPLGARTLEAERAERLLK